MYCMKRSTWCTDRFDRFNAPKSSIIGKISKRRAFFKLKSYYLCFSGDILQSCITLQRTEKGVNIGQSIIFGHFRCISLYDREC